MKFKFLPLFLVILIGLSACDRVDPLEKVLEKGSLKVALRSSPAVFYEHREGHAGFEYELVRSFAEHLGVELKTVIVENQQEMESLLDSGQVDLVAGGLGRTQELQERYTLTKPLLDSALMVVYRRGTFRPRAWEDIAEDKDLAVLADSRQAEVLRNQQAKYPELGWKETEDLAVTDLLKLVQDGELDYALVSAQDFNLNRFFFPRVGVAFDAEATSSLVWMLPRKARGSQFNAIADGFVAYASRQGVIDEVRERYYRHEEYLEYVGAPLFLRHVRNRLPLYEDHFKAAAEDQGLDWLLLAAVGFQESHWRRNAVSPTGVRGLMMLTQRTAGELGVNRLDPYESIEGGARYLRHLYNRLPDQIQGPDRTYMALAAYNVGYGHLEDARRITQGQGYDPNSWDDVAEHLPLLTQRRWYSRTRFGYARGNEPVVYVKNIRRYLEILEWHERTQENFLEKLEERAAKVRFETAFRKVPPMI
ncbi:membrane-bound lytic murein transglycosylase F [Marinospirillum celere]|uniref:Membrane-bound lytic murein transglycosylase F n=1 Tax=Marinospirillum celere TaxID=1122252 RepID=A0A1I1IWH0_9GAMM|nr:membrane-bound lytic murein transglycosylase MltF [Marinospirillum celere]SFC40596.1 membrane-bound lytic murein transglycosylase F [Marinospirillum celere]